MPNFLKTPNLPTGQAVIAAVGEDYADEISTALSNFGIKTLSCPNNPCIDPRLKSHIDLSVFHLGSNRFLLAKPLIGSCFEAELKSLGAEILFSSLDLSSKYPHDAALCALTNGVLLFHNLKYSDIHLTEDNQFKSIHVNQGYSKCAVCFVNESSAITSDPGIAKSMAGEGIDVLLISPRGIELAGFNEGFIGGASFKISSDKLAFTGTLDGHPDKESILNFLIKYKVNPIYLTNKPIFDIGSIIAIMEI